MRPPSPSGRQSPSRVHGGGCETERRARARGFPLFCSSASHGTPLVPFLSLWLLKRLASPHKLTVERN